MHEQQQYCLRWNNHTPHLLSVFSELLVTSAYSDVTLRCSDGLQLRAHKMVLSACSPYFRSMLRDAVDRHPVISVGGVRHREMSALLEFMYRGEVAVDRVDMAELLSVAECLEVKGLVEVPPFAPERMGYASYISSHQQQEYLGPKRKRARPRRISGSTNNIEETMMQRDSMDSMARSPMEAKPLDLIMSESDSSSNDGRSSANTLSLHSPTKPTSPIRQVPKKRQYSHSTNSESSSNGSSHYGSLLFQLPNGNVDGDQPENLSLKDLAAPPKMGDEVDMKRFWEERLSKGLRSLTPEKKDDGFSSSKSLISVRSFCSQEGSSYRCRVCHNSYTHPSNFHRHYVTTHLSRKSFPCLVCSKKFNRRDNMTAHLRTVHGKGGEEGGPLAPAAVPQISVL